MLLNGISQARSVADKSLDKKLLMAIKKCPKWPRSTRISVKKKFRNATKSN